MGMEIDGKKVNFGQLECDICHEPLSNEGDSLGSIVLSNVTLIPKGNFHTKCYKERRNG
jgi:hypothetical protein